MPMALEDFSGKLPAEPGKEWRIITPESVDPIKLLEGQMAFEGMARALGWEIKEVKKPTETELTSEEIVAVSKELFGTESYGKFAVSFIDWVGAGASGSVAEISGNHHMSFAHSPFHSRLPTYQERLPLDRLASERDIKRATRDAFEMMQFPFKPEIHFHPRYKYGYDHPTYGRGYHVATFVPGAMTRERMSAFLQKPLREQGVAPINHELHGVIGRAFDVLCIASGAKEKVDPADTEAQGEPIPYSEFLAFTEQNGVSKGKLQNFKQKIENAFYHHLLYGTAERWGEVVAEGEPRFYHSATGNGFRTISLDTISPSTLQVIGGSYERISPELAAVLDAYK